MAQEIELKLALPASAQQALLRHPLLKPALARRTETLTSIYYDTPRLRLKKSGVAVRLRRVGHTWLQTVKCAGNSTGGLSARPEWESPYQGRFDFSGIDDPAVRRQLAARDVRKSLVPVFETRFRRVTWQFDGVLLTLDRGWIQAGGRREAISEVELELTDDGGVDRLFNLADHLAQRLPLLPAPLSKAERGYRCHLGLPDAPARAASTRLDRASSPQAAFRQIAASCLDQLQRNHAGALVSDDPEFIHQMRVATRRLRACLRLFAPVLPAGFSATTPALRDLMRLLGNARDLDVLSDSICAPVMATIPGDARLRRIENMIAEQRQAARREVVAHLQTPGFGRLMILLARLLAVSSPDKAASDMDVATFATHRLRQLRRKVRSLARRADPQNPASLHALRMGIKRLRYAQEFFVSLGRGKARRRRIAWLAGAQDTLGMLNDLANAGVVLLRHAGRDKGLLHAVELIGNGHRARYAKLLGRLPDYFARLRTLH